MKIFLSKIAGYIKKRYAKNGRDRLLKDLLWLFFILFILTSHIQTDLTIKGNTIISIHWNLVDLLFLKQ